MSPYRQIAAGLETSFRWIGFVLGVEMAIRSIGVLWLSPGKDTVFQAVAGWSAPFILLGAVLVGVAHVSKRETHWRYLSSTIGHALGATWSAIWGAALITAGVTAAVQGREPNGLILAPPFFLLAALHGAYVYSSAGRRKWIRQSSGA